MLYRNTTRVRCGCFATTWWHQASAATTNPRGRRSVHTRLVPPPTQRSSFTSSCSSSNVSTSCNTQHIPSPIRVILDTNVTLNCIAFRGQRIRPLVEDLESGHIVAHTSDMLRAELAEVLNYPRLRRFLPTQQQRDAALAQYDRWTSHSRNKLPSDMTRWHTCALPRVKDANDQHLLDLALQQGVQYLVTKDRELLKCAQYVEGVFSILTPNDFMYMLHPELVPADMGGMHKQGGRPRGGYGGGQQQREQWGNTMPPLNYANSTWCNGFSVQTNVLGTPSPAHARSSLSTPPDQHVNGNGTTMSSAMSTTMPSAVSSAMMPISMPMSMPAATPPAMPSNNDMVLLQYIQQQCLENQREQQRLQQEQRYLEQLLVQQQQQHPFLMQQLQYDGNTTVPSVQQQHDMTGGSMGPTQPSATQPLTTSDDGLEQHVTPLTLQAALAQYLSVF